jgi:hypothetical protein
MNDPIKVDNTDQAVAEFYGLMADIQASLGEENMPEVYNRIQNALKELTKFK